MMDLTESEAELIRGLRVRKAAASARRDDKSRKVRKEEEALARKLEDEKRAQIALGMFLEEFFALCGRYCVSAGGGESAFVGFTGHSFAALDYESRDFRDKKKIEAVIEKCLRGERP